jgi:tRNA(Ile)-lysidine synthase
VLEKVEAFIRQHALMKPGDRVAAAVSGGADSVCLLRVLLELRSELGIVLSVAHYNHGIRGAESDADERFAEDLAQQYGLEFHCERGSAPTFAEKERLSLETAARRLRYAFFSKLLSEERVSRVATAHTLDDQAETVLMKFLRGAGTRGLGGIYPVQHEAGLRRGAIVRPLLAIRRAEVEEHLRSLGQTWRDDATNLDVAHARNRIRHELLPLLERDFNPGLAGVLADTAEIARAEEEYWSAETAKLLSQTFNVIAKPRDAESAGTLDLEALARQPLAVRRRLVRAAAESLGLRLAFDHVQAVLKLAFPQTRAAGKALDLPDGRALRRSAKELRLERRKRGPLVPAAPTDYEYRLMVPGEVHIGELGSLLRVSLQPVDGVESVPSGKMSFSFSSGLLNR